MNRIEYESVLTCPHCGVAKRETMPRNACLFYYECSHCKALLRPKPGDCCVFCSYGSVKCPPVQQRQGCCTRDADADDPAGVVASEPQQ